MKNVLFLTFFISTISFCSEIDDAVSFIQSKFHSDYSEFGDHLVNNLINKNTNWEWHEDDISYRHIGLTRQRDSVVSTTYSIPVKEISLPVTANENTVIFECQIRKCITGISISMPNNLSGTRIESQSHTWHFATNDDASRVANAMNFALEKLGATKRKF